MDTITAHRAGVMDGPFHPRVALVAHDALKEALVSWARRHCDVLSKCEVVATQSTGARLLQACPEISVMRVRSGVLGGDQQIGAMVAEEQLDALFFFVDPLSNQPHESDVKALMRLAFVYDTPCAFNPRSADLLISSGFLEQPRLRAAGAGGRVELSLVS